MVEGWKKAFHGDPEVRVENDFYPTPPVATFALVQNAYVPPLVWEPAAGKGHISAELIRSGRTVYSSDLYEYPDPIVEHIHTGINFLNVLDDQLGGFRNEAFGIITNPPYKEDLAQRFVEHALTLTNYVAVMCRLTFMESHKRQALFTENPPSEVLIIKRVHCNEEHSKKSQIGGMVPYAWYVWDYQSKLKATETKLRWIDMVQTMADLKEESNRRTYSSGRSLEGTSQSYFQIRPIS